MSDAKQLNTGLRNRVVERLGLPQTLETNIEGLRQVYAAWCSKVPFDNVRKLVALRTGDTGPLPGSNANDFLENWLQHGSGGTCWSSSNALFEVVISYGFQARRIAGSMRDLGVPGHGSVKVNIDGRDWMVDSSMLTMYPFPIDETGYCNRDVLYGVEVEPVDGTHLVWFDSPPYPEYFPCRLLLDPVDYAFYYERYEISRNSGPFNHHLSARYNRGNVRTALQGHTRHRKTAAGLQTDVLNRDELCSELVEQAGMSTDLVQRWVNCGALDAAYEPPRNPPAPLLGKPPSRRSEAPIE